MPYIPKVGERVKLRLFEHYTRTGINVWSWLRVDNVRDFYATATVLNGDQPTEQVVDVPLSDLQAPLGWQEVYEACMSAEGVDKLREWLKGRPGVAVFVNQEITSAGPVHRFFKADETNDPPHWAWKLLEVVKDRTRFKVHLTVFQGYAPNKDALKEILAPYKDRKVYDVLQNYDRHDRVWRVHVAKKEPENLA